MQRESKIYLSKDTISPCNNCGYLYFKSNAQNYIDKTFMLGLNIAEFAGLYKIENTSKNIILAYTGKICLSRQSRNLFTDLEINYLGL